MENNIPQNAEHWRAVNEYRNYEVSSEGRVRNAVTGRIFKCCVNCGGYKITRLTKEEKTKIFKIHRLVAEAFCQKREGKELVDHIDGNKLNNHYLNLRWVDIKENNRNAKKQNNCSSRFKGVCWNKKDKKWRAVITINNRKISLGQFNNEEDAGRAYNAKAIEIDPIHFKINDGI